MDMDINWNQYFKAVDRSVCTRLEGRIVQVIGLIAEGHGLGMSIGSLCKIDNDHGPPIIAEVVGFREDRILLMPYGEMMGIKPGSRISFLDNNPRVAVGDNYIGRVINGMGKPIDGLGPIIPSGHYPLYGKRINPMKRRQINQLMDVGITAINMMVPLGQGQRIAIMAGSGVGKSILIGMMTRHAKADVTIIGLIGERGREVKEFVEGNLGPEGLKKAVVVAATSDSPPLIRMRGAYLATTMAEYFMNQGKNVLLIVDSITRFAMSSRDVGLAAGEPPTNRGYTPSFFSKIPILLERAGSVQNKGSITGIYTVLVEGDDMNDPVGDTVRSIVDGHIVLSRKLANRGHFPAIDVLESISRVTSSVVGPEHLKLREKAIATIATYRDAEDMITIGAYRDGSDPNVDFSKKVMPALNQFLKQNVTETIPYETSLERLRKIVS
ncbi:MAG: FliI/YscN family ATPase [Desulfobacteraceae bacterium]|nr:MAG: FliI/YscN family ATPase [Desulfobacteraceae bacterium]